MECSSKKNRINKVEIIKVVSILVYLSVNNFRSVDVILRSLGTDPTRAEHWSKITKIRPSQFLTFLKYAPEIGPQTKLLHEFKYYQIWHVSHTGTEVQ